MYKYTICFIIRADEILLLNRENLGWMGSWNGVGGKIEVNETPDLCIAREVYEETGMVLKDLIPKGTVSWYSDGITTGGMYAYVAYVSDDFIYETPRKTEEGILDWKKMDWVFHPENTGVATNLPKFLPIMLEDPALYHHTCHFENNQLIKVVSQPLQGIGAKG